MQRNKYFPFVETYTNLPIVERDFFLSSVSSSSFFVEMGIILNFSIDVAMSLGPWTCLKHERTFVSTDWWYTRLLGDSFSYSLTLFFNWCRIYLRRFEMGLCSCDRVDQTLIKTVCLIWEGVRSNLYLASFPCDKFGETKKSPKLEMSEVGRSVGRSVVLAAHELSFRLLLTRCGGGGKVDKCLISTSAGYGVV